MNFRLVGYHYYEGRFYHIKLLFQPWPPGRTVADGHRTSGRWGPQFALIKVEEDKLEQDRKLYDESKNKLILEQENLRKSIEKNETEAGKLIQLRDEIKKESDSLSLLKKEIPKIVRETKQHHQN